MVWLPCAVSSAHPSADGGTDLPLWLSSFGFCIVERYLGFDSSRLVVHRKVQTALLRYGLGFGCRATCVLTVEAAAVTCSEADLRLFRNAVTIVPTATGPIMGSLYPVFRPILRSCSNLGPNLGYGVTLIKLAILSKARKKDFTRTKCQPVPVFPMRSL